MSDTNDLRPPEMQLDHLRQLSRDHKHLPAGAAPTKIRDVGGWSTSLDLLPARGLAARHPELFEVDEDDLIWLRVKCRSCREQHLMPLIPDAETLELNGPVKVNVVCSFAIWIAQRWCCEVCSDKEISGYEHAQRAKAVTDRLRASGVPRSLAEEVSWETMIAKGADDDQTNKRTRAIEVARAWAQAEKPKHALLITGDPGTGKTRLAATAAVARLQHSPISWVSVAVLMAQLDASWGDADRHEALKVMTGKGPVVLDDIDKIPNASSRTLTHLFTAIDRREQAGERAVIFTANAKPSELAAKLGDVLFSRITGMCHSNAGMLPFPGPDRRLELGDNAESEQALEAADRWGLGS